MTASRRLLLALALVLLWSSSADAAVTYAGEHESNRNNGSGSSFVSTNPMPISGTRPCVAVLIALNSATVTVSSVTFGGTGTPVEVATHRNGTTYLSIWSIPSPSGTGSITVTPSSAVELDFDALLFNDCDPTTPIAGGDVTYADGAAVSSLTSHANNLTANDATAGLAGLSVAGDVSSMSPNQVEIGTSTGINYLTGYATGTSDCTANFASTTGSSKLSFAAVRIAQTASAAATPKRLILLGVGD